MILTDGTTSLTLTDSWLNPDSILDLSTAQSAGGRLKTQVSGERFKGTETFRVTGAQLRSLYDIVKGNVFELYYTPTETPPEYTGTSFPIKVRIENIIKTVKADNNNTIYYHMTMEVTGTEYI